MTASIGTSQVQVAPFVYSTSAACLIDAAVPRFVSSSFDTLTHFEKLSVRIGQMSDLPVYIGVQLELDQQEMYTAWS